MKRITLFASLLALSFGCAAWSQEQPAGSTPQKNVVRNEAVKSAMPTDGKELYRHLCAACHGKAAKGDGPAAPTFKTPPADLTLLAKDNGGKYPADHVAAILRFGSPAPAHGSSEMPVWGNVLGTSPIHGTDGVKIQQRILALSQYLESLQVK
jgi:mono/diheme cytochrome c family protein